MIWTSIEVRLPKRILILLFLALSFYYIVEAEANILQTQRSAPDKIVGGNIIDGTGSLNSFHSRSLSENLAEKKVGSSKVSVATVAFCTLAMAAATGLGAVPFFFVDLESEWAGICNGVASGVMLAASFDLIEEGQVRGSGNWVVLGILSGGIFIWLCKKCLELYGEVSMLDIKGADGAKVILVVGIMTLHSFGEGSGVGVSFAGSRGLSQGLLITLAIAVHNIPEGLAVSMVLASRGVSPHNAMLWSVITSLPQPLVAVPSFICADAFNKILPFCTGFAAGCMIWMVIAEVLPDAFKEAPASQVASAATLSVASMEALSTLFLNFGQNYTSGGASGFLISSLFGLGPLLGGLLLVTFSATLHIQHASLTGVASGIAFVITLWRPVQLLLSSKMSFFTVASLLTMGVFSIRLATYVLLKHATQKKTSASSLSSVTGWSLSAVTIQSLMSCLAVALHALAEGLALGVAAPKAYGLGQHMILPVSLHGLPRGAAAASCIFGATDSWHASLAAATVIGVIGPMSAMAAMLAGIDYSGLDHVMVLACGSLVPNFSILLHRALKMDTKRCSFGMAIGIVFAVVCLACTKLVCLRTPYCNSAPEAVR